MHIVVGLTTFGVMERLQCQICGMRGLKSLPAPEQDANDVVLHSNEYVEHIVRRDTHLLVRTERTVREEMNIAELVLN